jgi:hypothetical protein
MHVSITDDPCDYAIKVASVSEVDKLLIPIEDRLLVGGPIYFAVASTVGVIIAYEFGKK